MENFKGLFQKLVCKPEIIFLILGLLFGILFMVLTPPLQVPDEAGHLHRAIEISNGIFYNKVPAGVSGCDKLFLADNTFKQEFQHTGEKFHLQSGYSPVMYIASSLGVKIGAAFKNPFAAFYLARVFNLFFWLAAIYFSIKLTPVFKWQFLFCALLPMSVFEGMSVSADSFVNAFMFLFFAYLFRLIFSGKEELSRPQIILYCLMTIISSLLKGCLIYPAFLIFFVKDKRKWLLGSCAIAAAVLSGLLWISANYVALGPEGVPSEAKNYICAFPFEFAMKLLRTVVVSPLYWIKGTIGILGYLTVKRFPAWFYLMTFFVFWGSFVFIPEKFKFGLKIKLLSLGLIVFYTMMVLTALFITWNPVDTVKIHGFQGRYFIALLPLFFIVFSNSVPTVEPLQSSKFKNFLLAYIMFMLVSSCTLLVYVYQIS